MTDPVYLSYVNIQYWYCVIYSMFGGRCTEVGSINGSVDATLSAGANVGASASEVDFWSWLFGGNASASSVSTSAPVVHGGLFGPILDTIFFFGNLIGTLISFLWSVYSFLAYTVSGLLFLAIVGLLVYLFSIRFSEGALYGSLPAQSINVHPLRDRWQTLLDGTRSNDPKLWRQGILEADMILGEVLASVGYVGKTTSDQILLVPENAFVTLPFAWEAHRIRNFVSASSSNYILTQQEAFRVMKLYEQVFQEFGFI